jgi:hypothetical protein
MTPWYAIVAMTDIRESRERDEVIDGARLLARYRAALEKIAAREYLTPASDAKFMRTVAREALKETS